MAHQAVHFTRISHSELGQNLILLCITGKLTLTEIAPFSWELRYLLYQRKCPFLCGVEFQGHDYVGFGFMGCFKDEETVFLKTVNNNT